MDIWTADLLITVIQLVEPYAVEISEESEMVGTHLTKDPE